MKSFFKWFFSFLLAIVGSALVLSQIQYPDRSAEIKPIAGRLLHRLYTLGIGMDDNSTDAELAERIVGSLKESGCEEVRVDRGEIVTTSLGDRNYWFYGDCRIPGGELARVDVTLHQKGGSDLLMVLGHSYCFDVEDRKIRCFTQSLVTLPSR